VQHPEYDARTAHQITDADLLAALLPNSPADLVKPPTAPAAAPAGIPTVAYLPSGQPVYIPVPIPTNLPAVPAAAGPLVPRWAVGTAVASIGVGGGAWMLSAALGLLADGMAAIAAGAATALPLLVVAGVAVAAVAGRRGASGTGGTTGVSVVQTVTQTITNTVRIGE
jgi:hypothetical protein